ncbi:MAG: hypothetical protein MUC85_04580 [Anaerolineales bacterium]|jgi:hypothetical protein|nr:hypothetical protein [Anaerolineales bacterium]
MQNPISLKSTERKVFQSSFADGLWDVFIGCFALELAIAPLLSGSMGDFWSSAIFLPFFAAVYLGIWLARKHIIAPRVGKVSFAKVRLHKIRKFSTVMVIINVVMLILGIVAAIRVDNIANLGSVNLNGMLINFMLGLFLMAGFTAAAYLLDFPRLYFYGLLFFIGAPVGEWLFQFHGASHHGYPIVFGFGAGVMILTGLFLFVRLLKSNPLTDIPEEEKSDE